MKNNNICIVGSGYMARKHCNQLKTDPRAKLNALVVSEKSKNADSFKNEFGFTSVYNNLQDALKNEDIDIVYIISPNPQHEKQVNASIISDKNVFCEKPLAYSKSEFDSIEKNLSKSSKVLQVGMNCRYREQFSIPKKMCLDGELGNVHYIKGTYIFNSVSAFDEKQWWLNYPEGIFPFLHTGAIHSLDILRWMGGNIKSVTAAGSGYELKNQWGKDNFAVLIEFENGIIGEFTGSASANRPSDFSIEIWGSNGSVIGLKHYYYKDKELTGRAIEIKQEKMDLQMQFDDLISSIENNKQPMNSFAEARKNFEFISAIENSVKTNKKINLI